MQYNSFLAQHLIAHAQVQHAQNAAGKRAAVEQPFGLAGGDAIQANKRACQGDSMAPMAHASMLQQQMTPNSMNIAERAGSADPDFRECHYLGVRWSRKKGKWRVRIKANGKVKLRPHTLVAGPHPGQ
jgi:hypothetical protein